SPKDEIASKWSDSLHYMHCVSQGGRRIDTDGHIKAFPRYVAFNEAKQCQVSQLQGLTINGAGAPQRISSLLLFLASTLGALYL
ncbi:unnamed protein product, partial [Allacma fusca]